MQLYLSTSQGTGWENHLCNDLLCRVGCKTLTQSINHAALRYVLSAFFDRTHERQKHCEISHLDVDFASLLHDVAEARRLEPGEQGFGDLDAHRYNSPRRPAPETTRSALDARCRSENEEQERCARPVISGAVRQWAGMAISTL